MGCTYATLEDNANMTHLNNQNLHTRPDKRGGSSTLIESNPELMSDTEPIIMTKKEDLWMGQQEEEKGVSLEDQLKEFVAKVFDSYDKDKNGLLDLMEFGKLLRENINSKFTQQEVEQLLRVIDDNKNRTVDKEELLKLYRRLMKS